VQGLAAGQLSVQHLEDREESLAEFGNDFRREGSAMGQLLC